MPSEALKARHPRMKLIGRKDRALARARVRRSANEIVRKIDEKHRAYMPRGGALELWKSRDEEILIEGPAGTGKTRGILEKVYYIANRYPGCRILLTRKTRESMTESVLVTWEEKVVPPGSPIHKGPKRNLRQAYQFPNGSVVVIGGMDKPMKIMSTEYDIICCFETTEMTEEDIESLTTRLRNGVVPYQQLICDCNPAHPNHWLNKRPEKPDVEMKRILSRHEDNPILHDGHDWTEQGKKYIRKLERLSGARKHRLRYGKWVAAEGIVYEVFDPNVHLINKREVPKHWRRIRVIDFGYKNPFVCQWWAIDEDGRMYMYREIYMTHRIVKKHAEAIRQLSIGEEYEATIADHDAEDRATLEEEGIFTIPAFKNIKQGIDACIDRLNDRDGGKPRVMFMRDALVEADEEYLREGGLPVYTVQEFDNYQWAKGQDGKPIKELPVDKDNHGMDAFRYAVTYVDNTAGMTIKVVADEVSVVN